MTIRLYDNPGKISIFNGNYELSIETADLFADFLINAPNEVSAWLGMGNMGEKKTFASINAFCTANMLHFVLKHLLYFHHRQPGANLFVNSN